MTSAATVLQTSIPDLQLVKRGKVRDVYGVGDEHLLIVATDRISAFDCVLPTPIKLKGAVLMGHSESGFFPEQAALINPTDIKALITIETVCPALSREQIASLAKIPTLVVFGDHLADVPSMPTMWKERFESCGRFVQQVNAAGGDATMMQLPKYGQFGNSHMLMQDKNSNQVADLILKWIDDHVENKQKHNN